MKKTKKYYELVAMIEKKKKGLSALLDESIPNSQNHIKLSQEIDELIVKLYKDHILPKS